MKKISNFYYLLLLYLISSSGCYGQYSISGDLGADYKNKKIYLSLLQYDNLTTMRKDQVLFSSETDSAGYFKFNGKLLSEEDKIYRIHTNLSENSLGFDFAYTPEVKNFENFIFSNTDTIVFKKSGGVWFLNTKNTNPIDKEWKVYKKVERELTNQLVTIKNTEVRKQSVEKTLKELKQYSIENKVHPLPTLLVINGFTESVLKKDYEANANFYINLYERLLRVYGKNSYTLNYENQLSRFAITPTKENLVYHRRLNYFSFFIILILLGSTIYLMLRIKKLKKTTASLASINLTQQEQKVAELILEEMSNKEIATKLFISLSTVKTHVRNLYSKFEVNNRADFAEKMKNQPGY
ncbi:helix-turn-helix transcriptional regulator [Polaribacter litorisediminis]|uniref:response regulator transcription factor n=1 Tax=Polaribacter litorisediminis TaxID=1908341 RepID=UPI001CBCCF56|nr:helix-turn-helix transcriptional regulator [Polaribacter litorisediminis]UAM98840.1 helix-turn-helix transcriptional regulator [Polaribacter litorisediminis]